MKKLLLASSILVLATPAEARDGFGYIGINGGIMSPKTNRADVFADFTVVQSPTTPAGPAGATDANLANAIRIDYKNGTDIDGVAGFDFGLVRAELEVAYKRAKLDDYLFGSAELASLSTALNRPSAAPDPFAPRLGALESSDVGGRITVLSAMANALLDVGNEDGFSVYGGGGVGRARVKLLGNRDDDWAMQLIAGVRYALTSNIDVGVKYRYFRTAKLSLGDDEATLVQGNPDLLNLGTASSPTFVERRTSVALNTDFNERFKSHSLLASLTFNFGGRTAAAPPPAAPPPPPPAPPASPPATQTCPEGSVVLATDSCPVAPPPPPPPPPAPERG